MDIFLVLSLCSLCIVSGNLQGKGFIKSTTLYFDEIQSSNQPKTLIECCGFCGTIDSCQGVKFDGKTCIAINNVLPNFRAVKENQAWLDFELFKKSQKVVLFSGSENATEIIDVSFESSHILPDTFLEHLETKYLILVGDRTVRFGLAFGQTESFGVVRWFGRTDGSASRNRTEPNHYINRNFY